MSLRTLLVVLFCLAVSVCVHFHFFVSSIAKKTKPAQSKRKVLADIRKVQTPFSNVSRTMVLDLLSWEVDSIPYPDPKANVELQAMLSSESSWKASLKNMTEPDRSKVEKERHEQLDTLNKRYSGGKCTVSKAAESCCIGSASAGGGISFMPQMCNHGSEAYDAVRKDALQILDKTAFAVDHDCDICRVIDVLVANNLTMNFIGDSVQRQVFAGFACELRRRGYNVTETEEEWARPKDLFWRMGVSHVTALTIVSDGGKAATTVRFYNQYLPNLDKNMSEMQQIAQASDILVFNVGVHVFEKFQQGELDNVNRRYETRYKEVIMKPFLEIFRVHNVTMAVHRETTAQHFDGPGGSYWLKGGAINDRCVPLKDGDPVAGWRERFLQPAANESGYRIVMADESIVDSEALLDADGRAVDELVVLPFFNFTARHHGLHPRECTHFCHTPYLWLPLWRSLRLAVDRKF